MMVSLSSQIKVAGFGISGSSGVKQGKNETGDGMPTEWLPVPSDFITVCVR